MAVYEYDDFEIRLAARPDGDYDAVASLPDGSRIGSTFHVPLTPDALEEAVVSLARSRAARSRAVTREVAAPSAPDSPAPDIEQFGATIANALFGGDMGTGYDRARDAAVAAHRGLRLSLSLADAPALLSLPWEFLYRRPRFIASQRHTPLVRRLETGSPSAPPSITKTVRILGVIASPSDLGALDVAAERERVVQAVQKMCDAGRVELVWLEPATPRRLREVLRDETFHILHFVGHSSFANGEGVIYLENDAGASSAVDSTVLANLLADQSTLRLVVLNSCEGARTTLTDPYAGVATTLIQLGVPAVVAMQFEISDDAAILFADELYTNLIGRQDPIDSAVAEARKAIYVELDQVEWATPVLFVRDPDVQLFDFRVPTAPLPPPPSPDLDDDLDAARRREQHSPGDGGGDDASSGGGEIPATSAPAPTPPAPPRPRWPLVASIVGAAAILIVAIALVVRGGGDGERAATTTAPSTVPRSSVAAVTTAPPDTRGTTNTEATTGTTEPPVLAPRPRTGSLAIQVLEADSDVHLYPVQISTGTIGVITDRPGAIDTEGVWDRNTNRVAFTRRRPGAFRGSGLFYVVPGDFVGDSGKQVAPLIPHDDGAVDHHPAWAGGIYLYWLRTVGGCEPGPNCVEELHRAQFDETDDGSGHLDALTYNITTDEVVAQGFTDVVDLEADPFDPDRVVVASRNVVTIVTAGVSEPIDVRLPVIDVAITPDARYLAVLHEGGTALTMIDLDTRASATTAAEDLNLGPWLSITPGERGSTLFALERHIALLPDTTEAPPTASYGVEQLTVHAVDTLADDGPIAEIDGSIGQLQAIAF